jgi:hypothetical protein
MYLNEVDGFEPAGIMMSGWPDFRGSFVLVLAEGSDGGVWMSFKVVIMMDVDFFKLYNDSYGYVQGDEVLRGDLQISLPAMEAKNLPLYSSLRIPMHRLHWPTI